MYQNKYPKMIFVSFGIYSINRPEAGSGVREGGHIYIYVCICMYTYI